MTSVVPTEPATPPTPPTPRRPPTLAEVAARAGVSHQTASRVLNDHPYVAERTRARVLAAVRDLGYRPNRAARKLATTYSRTLGVVGLDTTLFGSTSVLLAFERAARDAGYGVSIASLQTPDEAALADACDLLVEMAVDAILVVAPEEGTSRALAGLPHGVPLVAVEGALGTAVPTVGIDQELAGAEATTHLLDLGHRTVVHIAGPQDRLEARGRLQGWQTALAKAGRPAPEQLVGDWTPQSGYELGLRLLRDRAATAHGPVTAVFAANDHMAMGLVRALTDHNVDVPDDISVLGFDDLPESAYLNPPLSTVHQDFDAVGRTGLDLLLAQIKSPGRRPADVTVHAELVLRGSTAAPSSDAGPRLRP